MKNNAKMRIYDATHTIGLSGLMKAKRTALTSSMAAIM